MAYEVVVTDESMSIRDETGRAVKTGTLPQLEDFLDQQDQQGAFTEFFRRLWHRLHGSTRLVAL